MNSPISMEPILHVRYSVSKLFICCIWSKQLSDSISEHVKIKIFLGGMSPDPLAGACFTHCSVPCALLIKTHAMEHDHLNFASSGPAMYALRVPY